MSEDNNVLDESSLPTVLRRKLPPHLEKIRNGNYTKDHENYPLHKYLEDYDISVDETGSDVISFLRGKSILVTGGTGFLGKLLVEKLLRCCRDIDKIYIIVRNKKGKDLDFRIKEYFNGWVFVKLSYIYPNFREKVIGVSGDFDEDGLGLSEESRKLLTEKVNIVYHAAATVRFDEKLKKAVQINIKGTEEVIKLAKECKNLYVLTHISTAYSNCIHKTIKEEFYPPVLKPQDMIELIKKLPSDFIDKLTSGLVGDFPNTYVLTKQIAEDLIRTKATGIPTCIQRPSIVISSAKEPVRSWIDNVYGPAGLMLGAGIGLLHIMRGNRKGKCDFVPADYVVNNCIAASYVTAKKGVTDHVKIYNLTTVKSNPIYWKNLQLPAKLGRKMGSIKVGYRYFYRFTNCWYWYVFLNFILHTVPGHVVDFIAVRLGKKPILTKVYKKIDKFVSVLSYFTLNEWTFDTTNTRNLWNSLNEKDKDIFPFDMGAPDWSNYFVTYTATVREVLAKDFLDTLVQGRVHFKRLDIIHYASITTMLVLSSYFLLNTIFCFLPIALISIILFYVLTDEHKQW